MFVGPYVPQEKEVLWLVRYALCVAAGAVGLLIIVLFIRLRAKQTWFQFLLDTTASVLFLYTLVFSLFGWGEWYLFRHPHSSSNGLSLSAKLWGERFWGPLNSMGMRDAEFQYRGKDIVLVVGDSFAAGYGVGVTSASAACLPNRSLTLMCGPWPHAVGTRGKSWKSSKQWAGTDNCNMCGRWSYPIFQMTSTVPPTSPSPSRISARIGRRSYVGDFIYQRLNAREINGAGQRYLDDLLAAYDKEEAWEDHADDLLVLHGRCERCHIRLIVVIFPFPQARERSAPATKKVQQFFEHHGVEVVNLNDVIPKDKPMASLIANADDVYPSPELHHEVADCLAKLLSGSGVTQFAKRHDEP